VRDSCGFLWLGTTASPTRSGCVLKCREAWKHLSDDRWTKDGPVKGDRIVALYVKAAKPPRRLAGRGK
jgi:hypothetical protein